MNGLLKSKDPWKEVRKLLGNYYQQLKKKTNRIGPAEVQDAALDLRLLQEHPQETILHFLCYRYAEEANELDQEEFSKIVLELRRWVRTIESIRWDFMMLDSRQSGRLSRSLTRLLFSDFRADSFNEDEVEEFWEVIESPEDGATLEELYLCLLDGPSQLEKFRNFKSEHDARRVSSPADLF